MKYIVLKMTVLLLAWSCLAGGAVAADHYMRVYYIEYVPVGESGNYGEASYYEFPGADGVLGTSDDRNLLMDGGRSGDAYDVLIPFLRSRVGTDGIIWNMANSSAGADHYGGLEAVVDEFDVRNYYENVRWPRGNKTGYDSLIDAIDAEGCDVYYYDAGDYLSGPTTNIGSSWDPYVTAEVLCADADPPSGDDNKYSALIQIRCGRSVFLTGGDANGGDQEDWTVNETAPHSYSGAAAELADTHIYKVHHHGSKYSSYPDFMDQMRPSYAVAQMGYGYGAGTHSHPTKEALDRIWSSGGIVYRNDLDGTVLIKCDDSGNFDITRARAYVNETETPGGSHDLVYPPPEIPQNLHVIAAGDDYVSLDWDDLSGVYGYDIFRSGISDGDPGAGKDANPECSATGIYENINSLNVTASSYTDTGLEPGHRYYYRVSSKKIYTQDGYQVCYERRYSNQVSVTTGGGVTPTPTPIGFHTPSPSPSPPPTPVYLVIASADYDGDGLSDLALFRPSTGQWLIRGESNFHYGKAEDLPAPGDYNGDGTTDPAVFRPSSGLWAIRRLSRFYLGGEGDHPAPADYDGDGTDDAACFRPEASRWAVRDLTRFYYGGNGDLPVPGDWNADGTAEAAIFRRSSGLWAARALTRFYFGSIKDIPLLLDGSAAIFRPVNGLWARKDTSRFYFGREGDIPCLLDYDYGSSARPAIFRQAAGLWSIRERSRYYFGAPGDIPVTR